MNRRNFLKNSIGAGVAGSAVMNGLYYPPAFGESQYDLPDSGIPSPHLTKLLVKPLMTNLYHTAEWQGPCRFNVDTGEEEKRRAKAAFERFKTQIKTGEYALDEENCKIMNPDLVLFVEDFEIPGEAFAKIDKDAREADVFFIEPGGSSVATFDLAKKYKKPVVFTPGPNHRKIDISSYSRLRGLEVYIPYSQEDLAETMALLRARKVLRNTRILYPTDRGWPAVTCMCGVDDPEVLKDKFGTELVVISFAQLAEEMDKTRQSIQDLARAEKMAKEITSQAQKVMLDPKYVNRSMEFYNTIIRLMQQHNCNSFTVECFEFCTTRLPQKWEITPCLIQTMFKDLGIPSACQGDLIALMSMNVLMSLSKKSSHLGNIMLRKDGALIVEHAAPGIKMNGWKEDPLPYQLGNFVQAGWGTKAIVDFTNNKEKRATVVRMNPTAQSMLVFKGEVVDSAGWNEDKLGCAVTSYFKGTDGGSAEGFVRKMEDYGSHLVWVYGDYARQIEKLGKMTGFEVEVMS